MSKNKRARVVVVDESDTGRNRKFHDNCNGQDMNRPEFVQKINNGEYPNYHVRHVNGVPTPAANPNDRQCDNLG
jgi:hypothetical protein